MGHIRLSVLPNSHQWRRVLELLDDRAGAAEIVAASAEAAERELKFASEDRTLIEAVRLLAMVPRMANSANFADGLRALELDVPDNPTLLDLTTAVGRALDRGIGSLHPKTDFNEIARNALVETFTSLIGPQLPGLFGADAEDVRRATERLGRSSQFPIAAREFFSRVTRDTLAYFLSRVLSARIGPGSAFASIRDRNAFDAALDVHCREASRIIKEFSGGWYGKTLHERGVIDNERARGFAGYSLKKIWDELKRSRQSSD